MVTRLRRQRLRGKNGSDPKQKFHWRRTCQPLGMASTLELSCALARRITFAALPSDRCRSTRLERLSRRHQTGLRESRVPGPLPNGSESKHCLLRSSRPPLASRNPQRAPARHTAQHTDVDFWTSFSASVPSTAALSRFSILLSVMPGMAASGRTLGEIFLLWAQLLIQEFRARIPCIKEQTAQILWENARSDAPRVGLEPTTNRLTAGCSTD